MSRPIKNSIWLYLIIALVGASAIAGFLNMPERSEAALVDTGLVVQYYLDEAASGQTPTNVLDASGVGAAFNLGINYVDSDPAYTEVSGNRGLIRSNTNSSARASKGVDNTSDKIRDNFHGASKATLEVVVDPQSVVSSNARATVFGIQRFEIGRFELRVLGSGGTNATHFEVYFNGSSVEGSISLTRERQVVHVVLDTTLETADDRVKVYVNGVLKDPQGSPPGQNATIDFGGSSTFLTMLNNVAGTAHRPLGGTMFYAALYTHAFSSADVTTNYNTLTVDDDTPTVEESFAPNINIRGGNSAAPSVNIRGGGESGGSVKFR